MFTVECIVGSLRRNTREDNAVIPPRPKVGILIPAHNEEDVIEKTLSSLQKQVSESDRVLVVADNCSDTTADIVRSFNFEVDERTHDTNRGKGFALAHGLENFSQDPPDIVIILDADCLLGENALDQLVYHCATTQSPVQCQYLIKSAAPAKTTTKVSEFAVFIKNRIRMLGLSRLGASVHLSGTGMAFPYESLVNADLASGEIVEDMKLGIDLAIAKQKVQFIDHVEVESFFPTTDAALAKQRERWEHGHMGMIQRYAPKLLASSVTTMNPKLLLLLLDLIIPPLAFLITLILGLSIFGAGLWLITGNTLLLLLPSSLFLIALFTTLFTWALNARHILSSSELISLPIYVFKKIGSYFKFFSNREQKWVKTDRK